jgi:hypothetical protein
MSTTMATMTMRVSGSTMPPRKTVYKMRRTKMNTMMIRMTTMISSKKTAWMRSWKCRRTRSKMMTTVV